MKAEQSDIERVRISILTTVRNERRYLPAMLDSITAQSHSNWELLVVDDGSTDDTAFILEQRAALDPRIRLVSKGLSLGKVAAFNLAHEHASGDVVVLMAGDDLMASGGLEVRATEMANRDVNKLVVGYFKLRTISDEAKFEGMLLPRGEAGSRSGPSITMSRPLASVVFPVPGQLISEDTWLGEATAAMAHERFDSKHVVVMYRIHSGNSNPRQKSFAEMDIAMHKRSAAWTALLEDPRMDLSALSRHRLEKLVSSETLRHQGDTLQILLKSNLPLIDRLAIASMSSPLLFNIRTRYYRFFSGRRGR